MNLSQPTKSQFIQAEQALTDITSSYDSDIDVKKGSVIRQLLVRPYAYLYAQMNEMISNWITRTSVAYLSSTQDTSDSIADLVASNYFVERRQGSHARGVVTLTCEASQIRISQNFSFIIDAHQFYTQKTYIATASTLQDTQNIGYTKMYSFQGVYKTNIPVVAREQGKLEIPSGVQVTPSSYISGVTQAHLTSPITGGDGTETNAQMMQRCKDRCGSSIGTQAAIRTKMQGADVSVVSCNAVGSNQPGCFISRYNSLAIPLGGYIDVYVKTSNQSLVGSIQVDQVESDSQGYFVLLKGQDYPQFAGITRILEVQGQEAIGRYTIDYKSFKQNLPDAAARCSSYQNILIRFLQMTQPTSVVVTFQYQNGVNQLQDFMDSTYGAFLGQKCTVMGAVPATVRLKCQIYSKSGTLDEATMEQMKLLLSDIINSKQVGDYNLNMDQVAEIFEATYTDYKLRLPYVVSVSLPMTNGGTYTFNTSDGTVNLKYRHQLYHWNSGAYFFSTTPSYIQLQVL